MCSKKMMKLSKNYYNIKMIVKKCTMIMITILHYIHTAFKLVRDITKLSGYPPSNVKTRLEQSNYYLASGRFPLQNAIYDE